MDIYEIINHRQSDRQYDPERPVEPEKIRRILEAARIAPSACNAQPWHFIVVDEPELRNQVADAVASWLAGGRQESLPWLSARLWNRVCFPETVHERIAEMGLAEMPHYDRLLHI